MNMKLRAFSNTYFSCIRKKIEMQIKEVCKLPQISCMKIRIEFLGFYSGGRINEKACVASMRAETYKIIIIIPAGGLGFASSQNLF